MSGTEKLADAERELQPSDLVALYNSGVNISKFLRARQDTSANSTSIIEMSYELQAGSYVEAMDDKGVYAFKVNYARAIADEIRALGNFNSVMEAGVGEATTLGFVAQGLGADVDYYGFDISWSRVAIARNWLRGLGVDGVHLCTGDLMEMPYADNAIDVVYTSHSMEPNGGQERHILEELYRVAKHYLVLLEPDYENAAPEAQARMIEHGYVRDLEGTAKALGYDVLKRALFPFTINPLNPTGITIIRKPQAAGAAAAGDAYACPASRMPLTAIDGALFSPDSLLAYPVIDGIPCLRRKQAIISCHLKQVVAGSVA